MCGIVGRVGPNAGCPFTIRAMADTVHHRGPDEDGYFVDEDVALGVRRLSIVDVPNGQQPAYDEGRDVVVVLNGEIYNHHDLRRYLKNCGYRFRSGSDTEVLAHLYHHKGKDFLQHLRGMFALAVWDRRTRTLLLARDRFGKKPLLYRATPTGMAFASEARALLQPLAKTPIANLNAINCVLAFGYASGRDSAFAEVQRLAPGSFLEWQEGSFQANSYWTPPRATPNQATFEEAIDGTLQVVEDAVRVRLAEERPMGTFLSGGIDSTIVTALAARNHNGPLSTFTIGFSSASFDESTYASDVANYLGTQHSELILEPDPERLLRKLAQAFDEPFADSSALPTLVLSEFVSEKVVVALTGDGGDEVFGGYVRYRALPRIQQLNKVLPVVAPLSKPLQRIGSHYGHRRLERVSRELQTAPTLALRYLRAMQLVSLSTRASLWTREAGKEIQDIADPDKSFLHLWNLVALKSTDALETMSGVDMRHYLAGDILPKVDIASMSSSLEARSPLLDSEVISYAASLPRHFIQKDGRPKAVLAAAARRLVPSHLIDRPKLGFGVPLAEWLRGSLKDMSWDLLTDNTAQQRQWFDVATIQLLLREHASGRDRDRIIWPLLCIELWARNWLD